MKEFLTDRRHWTSGVLGLCIGAVASFPALAFEEAPVLKEMVAAGKLPPVDQRLPSNPMVLEVVEKVGEYGGTMRRAILGGGDDYELLFTAAPGKARAIAALAAELDLPLTRVGAMSADAIRVTKSVKTLTAFSLLAAFSAMP